MSCHPVIPTKYTTYGDGITQSSHYRTQECVRKPGFAAEETGLDTDIARIHAHGEKKVLTDGKGLEISI